MSTYVKVVTALGLIKALNENQAIYNTGNRSYDSDAAQGASSVDIDAMPLLVAKSTGSGSTHADRKGPGDTSKINVPLTPTIVPVKEKLVDKYSTNGRMMKDFIEGARDAMGDAFDNKFIAAIHAGVTPTPKGVFAWEDIIAQSARLTTAKVPQRSRFCVIDSELEEDFCAIDSIKRAMENNPHYLENGIVKIKKVTFMVTANAPKINGNPSVTTYYGPGAAFILNQFMDTERVYDAENVQVNIDFISNSGAKLLKAEFADVLEITG